MKRLEFMKRSYKITTIGAQVGGMKHEDFESFCESEDLPIFIAESFRFTMFHGLSVMEID